MPGSGSKGYQDAARESSARVRSAWTMGVGREALPTIQREGATLRAIADALDAGHCPRPRRSAARNCSVLPWRSGNHRGFPHSWHLREVHPEGMGKPTGLSDTICVMRYAL